MMALPCRLFRDGLQGTPILRTTRRDLPLRAGLSGESPGTIFPKVSYRPLCSTIDRIERLVEHGLMPRTVPCLYIGLDLPEKVGVRPLLGGKALGTERAHLAVETVNVDRARLMILNHDLPADDDSGDVRAHGTFHKGVGDVEFRVDPGIARHPVEIDEDCIALHAGNQRADLVREAGLFGTV